MTETSQLPFILAATLVFLGLTFFAISIVIRRVIGRDRRIGERLASPSGTSTRAAVSSDREGSDIFTRLGSHLTLPDSEEITRLRFQLAQAGFFDAGSARRFYAIRILSLFGSQIAVFAIWDKLWTKFDTVGALVAATALIGLGLMAPVYYLRWRIKRRSLQCKDGFPDMIDLMVASIEAGLSMDMAMMRVAQEIGNRHPVLTVNLDLMNLELRAGRPRHEAMMNFAERIDLEEAKSLCVMLKQSEEMGASMGTALRTFSDDMRERRMLLAEEKAMALSAKLTVPLILFIFPTLMVMLLVPAAIRLMEALG